ncbi:putative clathrin assembly protein At1g03050 [Olea europaea var. sylvestris]|uniref:putative clathrin assembly protein At1g03050 n=1 Tax=Olea europaea var. sylvestris TaxID=158386 RepID=UPI000C1D2D68|nr:putative clathrin assembly protein At1g03050 [Olea europaea var. sylvestris]
MAPSTFRNVIGAVKDQTSISLAKVGSSSSFSDLEVAIVKATRHKEYPPDKKHIREILSITCYSPQYVGACISTISRRISKTRNWVVALKTLMLIQGLLVEGDPAFAQEIFFATRRGTRLLNMSDFQDRSSSNTWDYSAFIRTYALYLDEQLEFKMQGRRGKCSTFAYDEEKEVGRMDKGVGATPVHEMKKESIFSRIHHLMQFLERFLACRPAGVAIYNKVVTVALYPIVKESFQLYYDISEIIGILIDRFMELDIPDSVKVYEIFCRISKKYDDLDVFYDFCKSVGVARSSEYPDVEKIPQKKLEVMDEFIKEKSIMAQKRRAQTTAPKPEPTEETKESKPKEDNNGIKTLPPPEEYHDTYREEKKEEEETSKEKDNKTQEVRDLLNLSEDATNTENHGDKLALALFDGYPAPTMTSTVTPWEAFKESDDWEAALVQSASYLSNQKASLPGGFDSLMLDGMYQQGVIAQAASSSGLIATGSTSSFALGSTGRPATLALPAPTGGAANMSTDSDPFAASLAIAPPPYVQMFEMEKKQRQLVEEQLMWQQYARDGLQGQVGLANLRQNPYPNNTGGYMRSY